MHCTMATAGENRAAAGVKTRVGVMKSLAVVEADIVTDLETEAVAIVIAGDDVLEAPAVAVL